LSEAAATIRLHGSAADWCGRGVLLRGDPGAGKSALLARLLGAGAYLVADDLVQLERRQRGLRASAPAATGLIELRGNGIFQIATAVGVPVSLCVDLLPPHGSPRLPESGATSLLGVEIPLLRLAGDTPAALAQILVTLAARRVH